MQKLIKSIREYLGLSQADFAEKLGVTFATVNRWESGKTRPNLSAMKNIKEFCLSHDVEYTSIEEAWLNFKVEDKK